MAKHFFPITEIKGMNLENSQARDTQIPANSDCHIITWCEDVTDLLSDRSTDRQAI